jgi:phage tail protein X
MPGNEYLTHKTKDGDRWDLLAAEYYGDAFAIEVLLLANPDHASLAVLPSNLTLRIPLVFQDEIKPEPEGVTPWR